MYGDLYQELQNKIHHSLMNFYKQAHLFYISSSGEVQLKVNTSSSSRALLGISVDAIATNSIIWLWQVRSIAQAWVFYRGRQDQRHLSLSILEPVIFFCSSPSASFFSAINYSCVTQRSSLQGLVRSVCVYPFCRKFGTSPGA